MNQQPKNQPDNYLNSVHFVYFLLRWKKPLFIIALSSVVVSLIFSSPFFIKPKFKSAVVLFPVTTNSISKALLGDNFSEKQDILEFGTEEQAEQLLQILNSDAVRDRIIYKYNLMKHYDIDSTGNYPLTKLQKEYDENISFERTEFMSVKIEVYDTDAQMAADIANDIATLVDSVKTVIQRERAVEGLKIVEKGYKDKVAQIQQMDDSLKKIRNKGIFNYEVQSEVLNTEYAKALSVYNNETAKLNMLEQYADKKDSSLLNTKSRVKGYEKTIKNLEAKLSLLADYGGSNVALTDQLELERKQLSLLMEKYEKAKIDVQQCLPQKFVVNKAVKAEKKSYPIRWLLVLCFTLSSLFLAVMILLMLEKFNANTNQQN